MVSLFPQPPNYSAYLQFPRLYKNIEILKTNVSTVGHLRVSATVIPRFTRLVRKDYYDPLRFKGQKPPSLISAIHKYLNIKCQARGHFYLF